MAAIDIVASGLNTIMNAQRAQKREITVPGSKLFQRIVDIMVRKHYLVSVESVMSGPKHFLKIVFKYDYYGAGVIQEIKRHSKSSRRVYKKRKHIPRVRNGFATVIISTAKGVMTGKEARIQNLGGEIICHVF